MQVLGRPLALVMLTGGTIVLSACGDNGLGLDDLDPQVASFVLLLNDHRLEVGCGALSWNEAVADVALGHSVDMVQKDFFAHTNLDGESPFDRLTAAEISYSGAAENIAWGYATADAVFAGWLDSPGHRANIENCSLTTHGVGLAETYWTHLFVTP